MGSIIESHTELCCETGSLWPAGRWCWESSARFQGEDAGRKAPQEAWRSAGQVCFLSDGQFTRPCARLPLVGDDGDVEAAIGGVQHALRVVSN